MPCRRDPVGGGGVVAEFFRDLQKPMRFSAGGGVVAEIFRDLEKPIKPTRFGGGGGGGSSAEFFFSVTSKRHFPLMGRPFFIFLLSRRGGPGPPGPP